MGPDDHRFAKGPGSLITCLTILSHDILSYCIALFFPILTFYDSGYLILLYPILSYHCRTVGLLKPWAQPVGQHADGTAAAHSRKVHHRRRRAATVAAGRYSDLTERGPRASRIRVARAASGPFKCIPGDGCGSRTTRPRSEMARIGVQLVCSIQQVVRVLQAVRRGRERCAELAAAKMSRCGAR